VSVGPIWFPGEKELLGGVDAALHLGRQPEPEGRIWVDLGGVRAQRLIPHISIPVDVDRRRERLVAPRRASHLSSKGDSIPSSSNLAWIWRKRAAGQTE
jgi:hypothetical protein